MMDMKCPICDKQITDLSREYMEHIMTEEYISCKDEYHNFCSMFAYGAMQETIGAVTFTSCHNNTKEERELLNRQFAMVVTLERKAYKKKEKRQN
jgi:hypothetical protein